MQRVVCIVLAMALHVNPVRPVCRYGFIVMDGNGTLFGTLSGNTREILHKFTVDLPKKHGRGGQSALRFARLRMEKRHNYVRKVRRGETGSACSLTDWLGGWLGGMGWGQSGTACTSSTRHCKGGAMLRRMLCAACGRPY